MDPYKQLMLALLESFKNDVINSFVEFQIEWLTSKHDLDFNDPEEKALINFLKDTAETFKREYKIEGNNEDG